MSLFEYSSYKPESEALLATISPDTHAQSLIGNLGKYTFSHYQEDQVGSSFSSVLIGFIEKENGEVYSSEMLIIFPGAVKTMLAKVMHKEPNAIIHHAIDKSDGEIIAEQFTKMLSDT